MAKAFTIQTVFNGGEIDPRMKGRVDIPRYRGGLETLTNAHALVTGGATRRPGTRFVYDAGTNITVRLFPFTVFRSDISPPTLQGFVIEFRSDNKIRFHTNGAIIKSGGIPYEIVSPFTNANLRKIRFAQFNNGLYFVHPDFPPQALVRNSDVNWQITVVSFTQPSIPHWDATGGYPSVITFFEQRLLLGAPRCKPQTIWGSQSGNVLNLVTGTGDSDPFEFLISAATSNIQHLVSGKHVIILCYDKELTLTGGKEKAITPTNAQIKEQTTYGTKEGVPPLAMDGELLFVTRHGKKVRSMSFQVDKDAYTAPDMSLVAGHLAGLGVDEMTKTHEPFNLLWLVTTDGKLLTCAFDREQEVVAWSKNITDGLFKSAATIPYANADQIWVAVQRTVGGAARTYIEVVDFSLNTDSAVTGADSGGKTVWTGLDHLNGKSVDIVADGSALAQKVVSLGQITLSSPAYSVEVGIPYATTIKDLPVEVQTPVGTAQGQNVSVNRVTARFYETLGGESGGQPFFGTSGLLKSEDKMVQSLGWTSQGVVTIEQKKPLPFTVLALIKEVTVNG